MQTLQREITERCIAQITAHPLFRLMQPGIDAGEILPCLRKQEVHFYEAGARLCSFHGASPYTHPRYLGLSGNRDIKMTTEQFTSSAFLDMRARAKRRREGSASELAAVHGLFPRFAVTRAAHHPSDLALIDVEIRFGKDDQDPSSADGMIDLCFLLSDESLLFVEAKCMGNGAISSMTTAKVVDQVRLYEECIQRPGVLEAINDSLRVQSLLTGRHCAQATKIRRRVPVLIVDPEGNGKIGPRNAWLRHALDDVARVWAPSSEHIGIIDGRSDPIAAICEFVSNHRIST